MIDRIDWRSIGCDLRGKGYGPTRISTALNRPKTTVLGWINRGSEPPFMDGHRLLALWAKVVAGQRVNVEFYAPIKNSRDCVPRTIAVGVSTSLTGRDGSSNRALT